MSPVFKEKNERSEKDPSEGQCFSRVGVVTRLRRHYFERSESIERILLLVAS